MDHRQRRRRSPKASPSTATPCPCATSRCSPTSPARPTTRPRSSCPATWRRSCRCCRGSRGEQPDRARSGRDLCHRPIWRVCCGFRNICAQIRVGRIALSGDPAPRRIWVQFVADSGKICAQMARWQGSRPDWRRRGGSGGGPRWGVGVAAPVGQAALGLGDRRRVGAGGPQAHERGRDEAQLGDPLGQLDRRPATARTRRRTRRTSGPASPTW